MADTLFVGKYIARFKPNQSKYASCIGVQRTNGKGKKLQYSPRVIILKPHGCLSWHLINSIPYSLPDYSIEDSLIITPGLNKYREGYSVPFDIHRARANEEIDKAQRYIIIGYGRQNHQGYSIKVNNLYETKNGIYIKTEFQGPKEYSNSENVTYPYIVVKIQQTDKSVIFSE